MALWNCRLIELNGEAVKSGWVSGVEGHTAEKAAIAYCHSTEAWEAHGWTEDSEALLEVEEHGGENGVHRMRVTAYTSLEFSAEPEEDDA